MKRHGWQYLFLKVRIHIGWHPEKPTQDVFNNLWTIEGSQ